MTSKEYKIEKGEKLAFKHATNLVKSYREKANTYKVISIIEGVALLGVSLWTMKKLKNS